MILKCVELEQIGGGVRLKAWKFGLETHHKLLVEGRHYNELDRQELGKRTAAN